MVHLVMKPEKSAGTQVFWSHVGPEEKEKKNRMSHDLVYFTAVGNFMGNGIDHVEKSKNLMKIYPFWGNVFKRTRKGKSPPDGKENASHQIS